MQKLAITGASGFIGQNFISKVKDFEIKEVDLLLQKPSEVDFIGCDSVLHLAALVHQMKGAPEKEYYKVNSDLTYEIAKHAKSQGVKQFVFMSTVKVFGESTTAKPAWNEQSGCFPSDPYGKSKYEAERLLKGLESDNFKIAIVRSPLVYGAQVKANMLQLTKLVDKLSILPLGGIKNCRSMVYTGNLIALLAHIVKTNSQGVFLAGDDRSVSTTELVQIIATSFNKKVTLLSVPFRFVIKALQPAIYDRLWGSLEIDGSAGWKRIGFVPPFKVETGIAEMVAWYKAQK